MQHEKQWLLETGMPRALLAQAKLFEPSSVGIIMHTGSLSIPRPVEPQILLVRQHDQLDGAYHPWGIPAGHVKDGESIKKAARREAGEETGVHLKTSRLKWFCPSGRGIIFTYQLGPEEFMSQKKQKLSHNITMFRPPKSVNRREIDMMALVPVEIWMDHAYMVPRRGFSANEQSSFLLGATKSDEDKVMVTSMYKPNFWHAIRHQMFVRKIIPPYLG